MNSSVHEMSIDDPEGTANRKVSSKPSLKSQLRKNLLPICIGIGVFLVIIVLIIVSVVLTRNKASNENKEYSGKRVDCVPWLKSKSESQIKSECNLDYCVFDPVSSEKNSPKCFYDMDKFKLRVVSEESTKYGASYVVENSLDADSKRIKIEFESLDDATIRFKISKPSEVSYEVPIDIYRPSFKAKNPKYEVEITSENNGFGFRIIRKSTKTVLWDTSLGPILFEKFNRQISTKLPSENVYGMGENMHKSFRHDLNYRNWPVFARDQIAEDAHETNLYGTQPFYTCMENDGHSHGVVLINSNAFDYEFLPTPGLTYRVTGGVLDFYMFLGPEPENVIQQFTKYIGRSFMPPYWALGFQISRYGYESLDDMKDVLKRFQQNNIPLDTQVADIDHYDERKDFTVDPINWKGLPEYFSYLKEIGMKTVMILDPALIVNETNYWPYETARDNDVFIRWPGESPDFSYTNSTIMLGYCWPKGKVAYPDFFKKSTQKWWIDSIERHYQDLIFDGLWIDMNEPAVFGTNEERPFNWPENDKPYWSLKCPDDEYETVKTKSSYMHRDGNKLSDKTLCMTAVQGENNEYKHFDVHNLYGLTESVPTFEAAKKITGTRGFVITRSTFLGSGRYGGHWTGDNHSLWSHLRYSIIGMLEFNMFGIPYVGADICGFFEDTTDELCARWSSLGAFYPFSRNHNGIGQKNQDPGSLGQSVINSAHYALHARYEILPYYYTLFYKAHKHGNTVARPLHFEFPKDNVTYGIDRQFLIGPAFLVTPVLDEGKIKVNGYFPADNWYSYEDGESIELEAAGVGAFKDLSANIDKIPLHIRGGYIIPTQTSANTTVYSRKNPFGLMVAPNIQGEAFGDLYYDDGESENLDNHFYSTFTLRDGSLKMNIDKNNYPDMVTLTMNKIRIFVKADNDVKFFLNKKPLPATAAIKVNEFEVIITNINLPMNQPFEISWTKDPTSVYQTGNTVIDCSMQPIPLTRAECEKKKCQFNANNDGTPACYIPSNVGGYQMVTNKTDSDKLKTTFIMKKIDNFALIENDVQINDLDIIVEHGRIDGKFQATNIKIVDSKKKRYTVPITFDSFKIEEKDISKNLKVNVENNNGKAFIEVSSVSGQKLFNTKNNEHGFVYSEQFIQIVMNIAYKNIYGMGENSHYSYKHEYSYSNWWGVFARDQPPGDKVTNLYGTQPFFMAVDELTGRAFGVLIHNSNAQEYGFLPEHTLSYRTLGGILDFYIMEEDSPEKLIQAYTSLIGKPYMPPYWSLGFQLCKYGYNSLERLQAAVERTMNAQIPLDIQYADIDHFERNLDFTYDKGNFSGLPEYIKELKTKGVHFIIILDPALNSEEPNYQPFINGKNENVFMKWPKDQNPQLNELKGNNEIMLGYVWPDGKTAFPDFFKKKTQQWWIDEIKKHYKEVTFDGLWIDMNEPANFDTNKPKPWNWPEGKDDWNLVCPKNNFDDPPYLPLVATHYSNETKISDKTMCMRGLQGENDEYIHYDVHNLYGWSQTEPTLNALRETLNKRSIVISRSTYPSSGAYAGHWLGDNTSIWPHLKQNIIGLLEFNLFGIPYIGADICGFFKDSDPEMCTRWMQIGAFQTFFRNHNGFDGIDQDPAALGMDVAAASKSIIEVRYRLLPFLYSMFYEVNQNGGTIIRSLVHEFPQDPRTSDVDRQFMWGSSLLISPVLDKNKRTVFAYFPKSRWFDYYTGAEITETGRVHELDVPLDYLPLHIKGGSLILTQEPALNTIESRQKPFGLIVTPGDSVISTTLFVDDGDQIDYVKKSSKFLFTYNFKSTNQHVLQITQNTNNHALFKTNTFDTLRLLGVESQPSFIRIVIKGKSTLHYDFDYVPENKELTVNNLKIELDALTTEIQIEFPSLIN